METRDPWNVMLSYSVLHRGWNDPLFKDGLNVCSPLTKVPCVDLDDEEFFHSRMEPIQCSVVGCKAEFSNVMEQASHQRTVHTHVCCTCRHTFPTHHLLDIHILEAHDSLFQLMAERKPMYQCFLESCNQQFNNPSERKNHCIKEHKFPPDFRFDTLWRKLEKSKGKQNKDLEMECETNQNVQRITFPDKNIKEEEMECVTAKKSSPKVPNYFSFGIGVPRGFNRGGRGRGQNRHQRRGPGYARANKDISMKDVEQALTNAVGK